MKPRILGEALKRWLAWQEGIEQARAKFDFKTDFTYKEYDHWKNTVGWRKIVEEATKCCEGLSFLGGLTIIGFSIFGEAVKPCQA